MKTKKGGKAVTVILVIIVCICAVSIYMDDLYFV